MDKKEIYGSWPDAIYRNIETRKQAGGFLNLCFSPELSCEVTLQPIKRLVLAIPSFFLYINNSTCTWI